MKYTWIKSMCTLSKSKYFYRLSYQSQDKKANALRCGVYNGKLSAWFQ